MLQPLKQVYHPQKGGTSVTIGLTTSIACCYHVEQLFSTYVRSYGSESNEMEESRTWHDLLARSIDDPQEKQSEASASPEGIPVTLYNRVLHLLCTTSYEGRFWTTTTAVLNDALKRLDPARLGLQLSIQQCMAPAYGKAVRCLRGRLALGTPPWSELVEQKRFFGAESLVGFATSIGRQHTIMTINEKYRHQDHVPEHAMSAVASPVMYAGRVAGCLLVVSTQPGYFSRPALLDLIGNYAQLLVLAFHPEDFYDLERIELQPMPTFQVQRSYVSSLQQRILGLLKKARIDHCPLSYDVAEQEALWQVEEELLQLATPPYPEA